MNGDLTRGPVMKSMLCFAVPMILGNLLQQCYNVADTLIVGQFLGANALAAVGSAYTLMTFLTSILLGLSMGSGVAVSISLGRGDAPRMRREIFLSLTMVGATALVLNLAAFLGLDFILAFLQTPAELWELMRTYLWVIFWGIGGTFLYNYYACMLRAVGDSVGPLLFLGGSALLNIVLDLLFVLGFHWDVFGVAIATVLSQVVSAVLIMARLMLTRESYRVELKRIRFDKSILKNVIRIGLPAGMQSVLYSVSNLVVQASINSFGTDAIASWAAIGKIDGFIWMVMSAFGIAITTFVGQNFGAQQYARVKRSIKVCLGMALGTTIALSILLLVFMEPLLRFFTGDETVIAIGQRFFWVMAPSYFTYVFIEILSGAIRGAGESLQPMLITCFGVCGLRILWLTLVVPRFHTMEMVAMNYPVTWVIAAVVFILYYLRMNWLRRCIRRGGYPMPETL